MLGFVLSTVTRIVTDWFQNKQDIKKRRWKEKENIYNQVFKNLNLLFMDLKQDLDNFYLKILTLDNEKQFFADNYIAQIENKYKNRLNKTKKIIIENSIYFNLNIVEKIDNLQEDYPTHHYMFSGSYTEIAFKTQKKAIERWKKAQKIIKKMKKEINIEGHKEINIFNQEDIMRRLRAIKSEDERGAFNYENKY